MLFSGCQTTKRKPIAVLDVYIEENGFFTITERKTGEGIAVRFNVAEVYRKELND